MEFLTQVAASFLGVLLFVLAIWALHDVAEWWALRTMSQREAERQADMAAAEENYRQLRELKDYRWAMKKAGLKVVDRPTVEGFESNWSTTTPTRDAIQRDKDAAKWPEDKRPDA